MITAWQAVERSGLHVLLRMRPSSGSSRPSRSVRLPRLWHRARGKGGHGHRPGSRRQADLPRTRHQLQHAQNPSEAHLCQDTRARTKRSRTAAGARAAGERVVRGQSQPRAVPVWTPRAIDVNAAPGSGGRCLGSPLPQGLVGRGVEAGESAGRAGGLALEQKERPEQKRHRQQRAVERVNAPEAREHDGGDA